MLACRTRSVLPRELLPSSRPPSTPAMSPKTTYQPRTSSTGLNLELSADDRHDSLLATQVTNDEQAASTARLHSTPGCGSRRESTLNPALSSAAKHPSERASARTAHRTLSPPLVQRSRSRSMSNSLPLADHSMFCIGWRVEIKSSPSGPSCRGQPGRRSGGALQVGPRLRGSLRLWLLRVASELLACTSHPRGDGCVA